MIMAYMMNELSICATEVNKVADLSKPLNSDFNEEIDNKRPLSIYSIS